MDAAAPLDGDQMNSIPQVATPRVDKREAARIYVVVWADNGSRITTERMERSMCVDGGTYRLDS
jgi:hypothetical protein